MNRYLIVAIITLLVSGCKHDHKPASAELQQAYILQQEALKINRSIDKLGVPLDSALTARRAQWLKNMVEIPGMDHDHSNCSHNHKPQTISITDTEMIAVQQQWKDSINVIWATQAGKIDE